MTFHFRGARILEWRRVQADAARTAFVRATESVREAAARVTAAEQQTERAVRDYTTALATANEIGTIVRYRNWIVREREHAVACRRHHEQRRLVAAQAASALQTAMRHVKVMERLRDRAWQRHLDAERQREMKELDQLATLQYARRKTGQGADREY
jgi:flagellar FliJ protein